MALLEWIVPLLIGAVALTAVAGRLGAPYPAFLAIGGVALARLPRGPELTLDPDLALALFVAPVLLDTAYDASLRDLRAAWAPITLLVLACVGVTTAAVAIAARIMLPELPWAAAVALGAIVAPPDATAATAILRQVRLPARIGAVLEGESLLNDASALFLFRLAIGTLAAGHFSAGFLLASFALVLPLSLAAGWLFAQATMRAVDAIRDVPSSIIVQFAATFGLWMLADRLQLSAVITIVAYAVTISTRKDRRMAARLRLPSFAVWETATFLLNVLAFVLIGLQLRPILDGMETGRLVFSIGFALAVLCTCIVARLLWVTLYGIVRFGPLARTGRFGALPGGDPSIRTVVLTSLVVGWSGMRGIVTLAAAFALSKTFPHRDLMLLTAFTVVLGTLVLQGLTLKPLLRWVDLADDDPVTREIGQARAAVVQAALAALDGHRTPDAAALRAEYAEVLRQAEDHPDGFAPERTAQDDLRLLTIEAGRHRLHQLRDTREIGNAAFSRIEFELDQAEMHASAV